MFESLFDRKLLDYLLEPSVRITSDITRTKLFRSWRCTILSPKRARIANPMNSCSHPGVDVSTSLKNIDWNVCLRKISVLNRIKPVKLTGFYGHIFSARSLYGFIEERWQMLFNCMPLRLRRRIWVSGFSVFGIFLVRSGSARNYILKLVSGVFRQTEFFPDVQQYR